MNCVYKVVSLKHTRIVGYLLEINYINIKNDF